MEIEAKYLLKNREQADMILADDIVKGYADESGIKTTAMRAVYYDTADRKLTAAGFALRVRREGDSYVATMKDKGQSIEGLHKREEINVRLDDEELINHPTIKIFSESEAYPALFEAAGEGELIPLIDMEFERRELRLDTGESISVLSVDDGVMRAGESSSPIMELELELYSGEEEDMVKLADMIAGKYELEPEDRSKFARAYSLLEDK